MIEDVHMGRRGHPWARSGELVPFRQHPHSRNDSRGASILVAVQDRYISTTSKTLQNTARISPDGHTAWRWEPLHRNIVHQTIAT